MATSPRFSTRAVHAGRADFAELGVHAPPLDLSSTYPVKDLDLDAAPEEGQHEEVARALDRAEETEQVARETEKDARAAEDEIAKADDPDEAELEEVREARQAADRARREADHAKQNLDDQTPQTGPSK